MKKRLAILLSLAMVLTFALAACSGGGGGNEDLSDSKYVGTWKVDSASFAGESDTVDDDITLTLNGDGTGTLAGVDEDGTDDVSTITWSPTSDGFKTQGDAKMTFKDDGDAIVSTVLGVKLRFVKADESGDAAADTVDGAAYGYAGDDPVELACYKYMAETVSKDYTAGESSSQVVTSRREDLARQDEVLFYGDFWV